MKFTNRFTTSLALALTLSASSLAFAGNKSYQVTGPILELTDAKIVVQKGKEKWELARNATTKIPADAKVGDKVTIYYDMTASEVEVKAPAKKAK